MPNYRFALIALAVSALMSWLFMRWANKKLRRSRRKEFPAFRHGGLQAQIGLIFAVVGFVALFALIDNAT